MYTKRLKVALVVTVATLSSGCTILDFTSSISSTLDTVTPDVTLNRFVDVRFASIQKEAAIGEGENLVALAHLLDHEDKAAFPGWMQSNYDELFNDLGQPTELVSRIHLLSARQHQL